MQSPPYANRFILKGGLLLASYVDLRRHTRDLDFLLKGSRNRTEDLSEMLTQIIGSPRDDGFRFDELDVRPLLHPHMRYPGSRATARCSFGKGRFKLVIDLGFGDIIEPLQRDYPLVSGREGALFESHVEIRCYPKEFIAAEKLEAICFHGAANSRMKDFHDLYVLSRQSDGFNSRLGEVIRSVFEHRGSVLDLPITFCDATFEKMQTQWDSHIRRLVDPSQILRPFREVVDSLNLWLTEVLSS